MTIAGNSRICRSILLTITIFSLSLPAYAKYSGGTGEPNDPYQIATATDLIALGETPEDYDKHFILTADIDLDPNLPGRKVFDRAVIAPDSDPRNSFQGGPFFTGVFDGNRHRILHLTIKGGNNIGLFSCLGCSSNTRSGEVKNLGVVDVSITGSGNCLGGLAGSNLGIIRRCYSTGTVSGSRSNWYGGVGGLIGGNGGEITDCYSTSTVSGDRDVGGLVGGNLLYWPGPFQYSGYSQGLVARCFSTGEVTGIECVGGLVGANGGEVNNCYSTSTVSGENAIGGLVGDNRAWVSNVDISYDVYGLVARCYSTGAVTGTSFVGGLVGGYVDRSFYEGIVSHSFWDMQTSGQATSEGGTGLTTNAMENIQTYQIAGWDLTGEIANGTHETWQVPEEGGYPVLTAFSGYAPPELQGQGTMEDPYLISDAMDLGAIIHYSPSAYYRLSASIDLSDIHWNTSVIPHLEGTFDGNGHAIRNLNIVGGGCLGLFGQIGCSAKASNLALEVVDVNGTGYSVGGLAGSNYGNISRSYSTGSVNGDSGVGGLVGTNSGNMISCYSTSSVTGGGIVGGLVGGNSGILTDCNSACTVSGTRENIGGLVGSNSNMIATSYSTGAVNGNSRVGGLAGSNGGNITSSYSTGSVSGVDYTGSLVGYNYSGRILTSYSTGSVNGNKYVGGLVGYNRSSVTQCYSIGSAIGISCVGGLVGFNYESTITTSYSTGSVSGNEYVGGLVGFNRGSVTQCYSTGFVSGTDNIGGLVGSNTDQYGNEGVVSDCFWDTETSGQATSDASIGKTTAEMQMASTFLDAGWDFVGQSDGPHDIWAEPEGGGYPILAWQLPPGFGLPTFSGGTGEPDDPYLISTAQELNSIGHNARLMNCHFTLVQSLDLMGVQFYPIGDLAFPYTGMFNGNGQTLSHLTITGESNLGLFAALGAGAIVRDLGVLDVNITGSGSSIGGLVGWNGDYWSTGEGGLVLNCYSSGSVSGSSSVGGLVGYNDPDSNITMSYSIGSVSGTSSVGGLVGYNFGKIATSYSTGEISGTRNVGGLVGYNASGSMIQCFSTASASGTSRIGGLVGDNWTGTLMQCYSAGAVDGNDYVGGLVGATKSIWDADTKALESFWDIETSGQVTSADGIGKTTAEMQTARTFLDAGWDFIGEVDNGTDDLWWILEGQDYPKLWRENDNN